MSSAPVAPAVLAAEASAKLKKIQAAFDEELTRYCRDLCRSVLDVFLEQKPRTDMIRLCMNAHAIVSSQKKEPVPKPEILNESLQQADSINSFGTLPLPPLPQLPTLSINTVETKIPVTPIPLDSYEASKQTKAAPPSSSKYNFYPKPQKSKKRKLPCLTSEPKSKVSKTNDDEDEDEEGEDLTETKDDDDAELEGQETNADYTSDPNATVEDTNWIVNDEPLLEDDAERSDKPFNFDDHE